MAFGSIALFLVVHIALVWMVTMMKKSKYKILAFFLIALSIFGYVTFGIAFESKEVDLTDFNGVYNAAGIYFSWLGSFFDTTSELTSRVIDSDSYNNSEK